MHDVVAEIARVKGQFMAEWGPRLTSNEVPISPYRVFTELMQIVDMANTIVTHDSGYPRDQLVPFWPVTTPRAILAGVSPRSWAMAWGWPPVPAAQTQVVNIMGDAAVGMAGMDFETASRSGLPILTVILNNGVMTHYNEHMPFATETWGSNKLGGNYARVAEGLGAYAEQVRTPDQIAPAMRRALQANQQGQPAVLEILPRRK